MGKIALYTFGLIDLAAGPDKMAEFGRRGGEIFALSEHASGFVGRANGGGDGSVMHKPGDDFGQWGTYALPSGLPGFEGHDPRIHIATLSLWQDTDSARRFVYEGLHREALKNRHDWFLKGPWPGYVLWRIDDGVVPQWSNGVSKLHALARDGDTAEHFTFGSPVGQGR